MNCGNSWKSRLPAWATSCARPASQGANDGTSADARHLVSRNLRTVSVRRLYAVLRDRERLAQSLGIHGDLDARAFLLQQHHRARIAAAPPTRESFRHLGEREIAHAHGHAELAAERIGERNVLVGELERKGRRIVLAGQELV